MKFLSRHPIFILLPILLIVVWAGGLYLSGAKAVFLWTDVLVYILVLSISLFAISSANKEHLRDPWRQVVRHKLGMASLVVLLIYVLIGLLDSVHFRLALDADKQTANQEINHESEVLSVLDILVTPIRVQYEKTYSAPFASHLYAKETVEHSDGTRAREFPRLEFGGAHLQDPDKEKFGDIAVKSFTGLMIGLVIWSAITLVIILGYCRHYRSSFSENLNLVFSESSGIPWRVILGTLLVMCFLMGLAITLAPNYHILGTDKVGQDVFFQSLKSIRTGLVIGTLSTLIMLPFAVMLGIMAGYFKGWVDDVIQYLYTTLNSIPGVLLIAAAVLMIQVYMANNPEMFETDAERADARLFFLCVILGITSWTGLCRLLRGEALKLSAVDYVQASQAFGVSGFKILWRHIQPNVMHIVLIAIVLDFSGLVLAEAVLSYVGVGVDPTMHSWGNLINGARLEMAREPIVWWSLLAAFIFMFALVLAANLFSDAVRDAFDPRLRKQ